LNWTAVLLVPFIAGLVRTAEDEPKPAPGAVNVTQAEALLKAVWDGDLAQARKLLEAGADANGDEKKRPLFLAARLLDAAMLQLLIDHKADPTVKDARGRGLFEGCMLKGWLKLALGRKATQLEKDRDLIQASIFHHGGCLIQEKSRIPHWGLGLIGHKVGVSYFWTKMGRQSDGERMARSAWKAMAFLRKQGAGCDPQSAIWAPASKRRQDRFSTDSFEDASYENGSVVWHTARGKRLVRCDYSYAPLWRMQYYFFDEELRLVRVGEGPRMAAGVSITLRGPGSSVPYAFVEYRSRDEKLPAAMRGKWMPAVAYIRTQLDAEFKQPTRFCSYRRKDNKEASPPALVVPIDVYGSEVDFRAIEYGLWDLEGVAVRCAENGRVFSKEPVPLREPPREKPKRLAAKPDKKGGFDAILGNRRTERAPWPDPAKAKAYEQIDARIERMRYSEQAHLFCSADPGGVHCLCAYLEDYGWDGLFFAGTQWTPQKPVISWRFRKGVVWKREQGDRIVIADARRGFALGSAGVFAFDKDLKLVSVGEYETNEDNPESFALVEFRSNDPRLPAALRGKWNLALAHNELDKKIDTTRPVSFGVWPVRAPYRSSDPADQENGNRLRIHPVDWYGDEIDHRTIKVPLCDLKDLEIRVAEPKPPFKQ